MLLTDVNHKPTVCVPVSYSWDILDQFCPPLSVVMARRYEKKAGGMYQSLEQGIVYDDADRTVRYGILSAMLTRLAR